MKESQFDQLKSLPQRAEETWQGGLFSMPVEGMPESLRPLVPLWVEVRSEFVHAGMPLLPGDGNPGAAVDALLDLPSHIEGGGHRPGRIEVNDSALAEHLDGFLSEMDVEVRLVDRLEAIERALNSIAEFLQRDGGPLSGPPVPGPLAGRGVSIEQMRSFAEAAAEFYRAAPWQYLTDCDLIRIEKPKPPKGMRYTTVLGAGRSTFGLGFYESLETYVDFRQASSEDPSALLDDIDCWNITFGPAEQTPPPDVALWKEHDLPLAGEDAYPLVMHHCGYNSLKRPGARQLSFLEGLLRALASTTEAEIDSGRWQHETSTFHGKKRFVITLPDLLDPPSPQEWMRRGFMPDRRAHERMFADMNRYFEQHPPADMEEMNEVANRLFSGRKFDDDVTEPTTPLERAQQLCFEAFDTHGRRRTQLARQAIEICSDCADAYVILAEQAGTLEAELDFYAKGVDAGRRALGAEAFEDAVGHFWEVTETRPYMRALLGLAHSFDESGRVKEATDHFGELLRLNPNDNQGVRYLLMPNLLELGRDQEAARLLKSYDEESANWAYARALLAYRLSGPSSAARRELRAAYRINPYVPDMLLRDMLTPIIEHYAPGSPEEAVVCVEELGSVFEATEGAIDWLAKELAAREREDRAHRKQQRREERQTEKKKKRR